MTFEEAIIQRVLTSPIALMLGAWDGTRAVHPVDRPQGAPLPAIVFNLIDAGLDYTHSGRDDLQITPIQADIFADRYAVARGIADVLGRLLEAPAEIGGIRFTHGFIDLERDVPVIDVSGTPAVFGRTQRFSIYHKE